MQRTSGRDLAFAKKVLSEGGLVAIPTETVYGLAANAFEEKAVAKIFKVKNRPTFNPLILHTDSLEKVRKFTDSFPELAEKLANAFWPGPLTLLLPKNEQVPDLTNAGLDTVAIRIPKHPLTLELLASLDFPLAAPSANPFGYISPTSAKHVEDQLGGEIEYVLDGGECELGLESTIISVLEGEVYLHRLGGLTIEEISEVVERDVHVQVNSSSNPKAPGMLKSHYSPSVPLILDEVEDLLTLHQGKKIGVLSFSKNYDAVEYNFVLSEKGDFAEAAENLYKALRVLDKMDLDLIIAEPLPNVSLGRAINDRLKRASAG